MRLRVHIGSQLPLQNSSAELCTKAAGKATSEMTFRSFRVDRPQYSAGRPPRRVDAVAVEGRAGSCCAPEQFADRAGAVTGKLQCFSSLNRGLAVRGCAGADLADGERRLVH